MRPDHAPRTGFTLIELLVVVSIIGILAGMLLPAVSMVMASARQTTCAGNLHQIALALEAYRGDFGVIPSPFTNPSGDTTPGSGNNYAPDDYYDQWYAPLRTYLGNPETNDGSKVWICPMSPWKTRLAKAFGLSYGMNGGLNGSGGWVFPRHWPGVNLTAYGNLGSLVVISERRAVGTTGIADYNGSVSPPYEVVPVQQAGVIAGDPRSLRATHSGRSVYLFADWHVEALTPWQRCNQANTASTFQSAPNIWIGLP